MIKVCPLCNKQLISHNWFFICEIQTNVNENTISHFYAYNSIMYAYYLITIGAIRLQYVYKQNLAKYFIAGSPDGENCLAILVDVDLTTAINITQRIDKLKAFL
jgi:hypothetical protein